MIAALALVFIPTLTTPSLAQIDSSDATFNEAVQAVKDKDFGHAVTLFSLQANSNQHDAQYNLALLLEAGKGAPQDFVGALTWAWSAQLGGIEAAEELADELAGYLPEATITSVLEAVAARLQGRIDSGDANAIPQFAAYHITLLQKPITRRPISGTRSPRRWGLKARLMPATTRVTMSRMNVSSSCSLKLARFMKALT